MSKKNLDKLSQIVLRKIQQKKQRQLANRPRVPVLNVMLRSSINAYKQNLQYKDLLIRQLQLEKLKSQNMTQTINQLNNITWQKHILINIKPQFLASQKIALAIKQFYRKSSNNFLKLSIIQKRNLADHILKKFTIEQKYERLKELEKTIKQLKASHKKQKQNQLIENMKQKLRYQDAVDKGRNIKIFIETRAKQKQEIIKQYQLKKGNLDSMHKKVEDLQIKIRKQNQKYQATYNLITYRQYLQRLFDVKMKIQVLQSQMKKGYKQVDKIQHKKQILQKSLIKKNSYIKYGKLQSLDRIKSSSKIPSISALNFRSYSQRKYDDSKKRQSSEKKSKKSERTLSTSKKTRITGID